MSWRRAEEDRVGMDGGTVSEVRGLYRHCKQYSGAREMYCPHRKLGEHLISERAAGKIAPLGFELA